MRRELLVITVAVIVSIASILLHVPTTPAPLGLGITYSDINAVFYMVMQDAVNYVNYGEPRIVNVTVTINGQTHNISTASGWNLSRWFSPEQASRFTETRTCPVPYLDYGFEYPPLVGLLWYASTCLAFTRNLPENYNASTLVALYNDLSITHYAVHAVVLASALVASAYLLYNILLKLNPDEAFKRTMMFILLPSTLVYTVYNWDILAVLFTLMSILFLLRAQEDEVKSPRWMFLSGLAVGLASSAKLLPVVSAVVVLAWLVKRILHREPRARTALLSYIAGGAIGVSPLLVLFVFFNHGFTWMLNYISSWQCENCIYNMFTHNVYSPLNRYASMAMVILATSVASIMVAKGRLSLVSGVAVSAASAAVFNYIYTPQMILLVNPMLLILLPKSLLPVIALADVSNTMIIAFFFNREILVNAISELGLKIREPANPFETSSIIQVFANIRNILHATCILSTWRKYRYLKI